MKKLVYSLSAASLVFFSSSCRKEIPQSSITDLSYTSPLLEKVAPDYPNSNNDDLAQLGRVLFYDPKLSLDNSISCGSCHLQEKAFADKDRFSKGIDGQLSRRNAPCVFPKSGKLFWDGRASNLNQMVLMPIEDPKEMNIKDFNALCSKLATVSYYPELFKKAFKQESITKDKIATALTDFVRNFTFTKNKFGTSGGVGSSFTPEEKAGNDLFFGKAKCSSCHQLSTLGTGTAYYNSNIDRSHNIGLDYEYADKGCGEFLKDPNKNGEYMNPLLFNIELTAPYMHDGRFNSLEEVIEHYDNKVVVSPTLDWRLYDYSDFNSLSHAQSALDKNFNSVIDASERGQRGAQKLNLTKYEKGALVAFLRTLTDLSVLTDKKFSDPFK